MGCEKILLGSLSLIIRGNNLDFEEINTMLKLQPVKVKRKGEPITLEHVMNDDCWSYKVEYEKNEMETALDSFLNDLKPSAGYIRNVANEHRVYIFVSLRSNLGQMGFELKPEIIKSLADLNIAVEVHILSYGEA